jgi:hypothetical protein
MWHISYRAPIMGTRKVYGPIDGVATETYEYHQESCIIDIHPFEWVEKNPRCSLVTWQKLTREDKLALQKVKMNR